MFIIAGVKTAKVNIVTKPECHRSKNSTRWSQGGGLQPMLACVPTMGTLHDGTGGAMADRSTDALRVAGSIPARDKIFVWPIGSGSGYQTRSQCFCI